MATLGEQAVGSIVKLNVNGTSRDFIVVHKGKPSSAYDGSCDGIWLLMKDLYVKKAWDGSNNDYANSDIHSYLNNTFFDLFSNDIQGIIKQIKIPYTNGTGTTGKLTTGSNGISARVFLLSRVEVGLGSSSSTNTEGAVLSYFDGAGDSKRIAYFNGTANRWWLRTPYITSDITVTNVRPEGFVSGLDSNDVKPAVRPAIILPSGAIVTDSGLVDGTIVAVSKAITGSVTIGGVQRELTGAGYINIGGVIRDLSDAQTNIGGTLKSLKG